MANNSSKKSDAMNRFKMECASEVGVSLKDGYKPVFVVSVIVPLICTAVIALMYTIYPGWA